MMAGNGNRIGRKDAQGMEELISQYIREMKLAAGLGRQHVYDAWMWVSGASAYTVDLTFRNGVLYCTLSSSVVRNRLYFRKAELLRMLNECLEKDPVMMSGDNPGTMVRDLILR